MKKSKIQQHYSEQSRCFVRREHLHCTSRSRHHHRQQQQSTCKHKARSPGGVARPTVNKSSAWHAKRERESERYAPSSASGAAAVVGAGRRPGTAQAAWPRGAAAGATRARCGRSRSRRRWCPRTCRGARPRRPSAPAAPTSHRRRRSSSLL